MTAPDRFDRAAEALGCREASSTAQREPTVEQFGYQQRGGRKRRSEAAEDRFTEWVTIGGPEPPEQE